MGLLTNPLQTNPKECVEGQETEAVFKDDGTCLLRDKSVFNGSGMVCFLFCFGFFLVGLLI